MDTCICTILASVQENINGVRFLIDHSIILLGCVIQHGFLNGGILFSLKLLGRYFKIIGIIGVVRRVVCRDM